jgi:hypothetical protein
MTMRIDILISMTFRRFSGSGHTPAERFPLWNLYEAGHAPISIFYGRIGKYAAAWRSGTFALDRAQSDMPWPVDCNRNLYVHTPARDVERSKLMLDVILLAVGLGFFVLSIAYVYGCERL